MLFANGKENGGLVGRIGSAEPLSLADMAEYTGCEESLRCADGDGEMMTLSAVLDPDSGELAWAREDDEGLVEARVLGTNQVSASLRCDTLYTTCLANFFSHVDF
jgi:hypothetical protein